MSIAISGIGLATAQGSTAEILESKALHPPAGLPWTANNWNVSKICYPALDIDSSLSGAGRWQALVKKAFADLGELSSNTPLLVASCNGDASQSWEQAFDTTALLAGPPWAHERLPVFIPHARQVFMRCMPRGSYRQPVSWIKCSYSPRIFFPYQITKTSRACECLLKTRVRHGSRRVRDSSLVRRRLF